MRLKTLGILLFLMGTLFLMFVFVLTLFPENSVADSVMGFGLHRYRVKARLGKGAIGAHLVYTSEGMILTASQRIGLWFYDTQTGEEINILREQTDLVTIVLSGGRYFYPLYMWEAHTGKLLSILWLTEHTSDFTSFDSLWPYRQILANASYAEIRLWNAVKHLNTLMRHTDYSEMTDTLWGGWRIRYGSY